MSAHWKHAATRCAVEGCERTRRKGWTTCALIGHAEHGIPLRGLAPKAPKLRPFATVGVTETCERLRTFTGEHAERDAAEFIGTLDDAASGRYYLDVVYPEGER